MVSFSHPTGYRIIEELHRGRYVVSRCERVADGRHVVIKATDTALTGTAARLRYEHRILLALAHAPNVHLAECLQFIDSETCALVVADCGAYDLMHHVRDASLPLHEVLTIGTAIAQALTGVHAAQVIHKDINPRNVVYNRQTGAVQLIDFGIATQLDRQAPSQPPPAQP